MPPELTPGASAPPTIMIVDDEPLVRDVLLRWLTAEGFCCRTAADAESAWMSLQQQPVDLVTSDINMPGVSGVQLLGQIRAAFPEMAVLMLTGCGDTTTAIRASLKGLSRIC